MLSVILPAYDEAGGISDIVRATIAATPPGTEVIVVDDGSSDDTAARAARAGARVLRLDTNRGKGFALRHGVAHASGDVLVFLDADGQDPPGEIPRLVQALDQGADLVLGSRFLGRFEPGSISRLHRWGNRALTAIVNAAFDLRLTDSQAGFRCLRQETFLGSAPTVSGYDVETDLLLNVAAAGGQIVEVPVTRRPRTHGGSKLRTVIDGGLILLRILSHRARRYSTRHATGPPARNGTSTSSPMG